MEPSGIDLRALRESLEARALVLKGEVSDKRNDGNAEVAGAERSPDRTDMAFARVEVEIGAGEALRDEDELAAISATLARIGEGQYGVCIDCGDDIPLARLRAQPLAIRCIACQQAREGSIRRA